MTRYRLKRNFANYSATYRSKVIKFIEPPPNWVLRPCTEFGVDTRKPWWDITSLPVWRLRRQTWLVVTGNRFWIWLQKAMRLWVMVWRSSASSFMKIGESLWTLMPFKCFWWNTIWRKIQHGGNWRHAVRRVRSHPRLPNMLRHSKSGIRFKR